MVSGLCARIGLTRLRADRYEYCMAWRGARTWDDVLAQARHGSWVVFKGPREKDPDVGAPQLSRFITNARWPQRRFSKFSFFLYRFAVPKKKLILARQLNAATPSRSPARGPAAGLATGSRESKRERPVLEKSPRDVILYTLGIHLRDGIAWSSLGSRIHTRV